MKKIRICKWKKDYNILSISDKINKLNEWYLNKEINPINSRLLKQKTANYNFFISEYEYHNLNENDLELFFNKYSKNINDKINKKREFLFIKLINDELKINDRKYRNLKKNIINELSLFCNKKYNNLSCEIKAGRNYNYDFDLFYYNNDDVVKNIKLEFKYGCNKITNYPEFLSLYCSSFNAFLDKDYIKYYYDNLDDFIESFPIEKQQELKKNKPTYSEFLKIVNDAKYKHKFQNLIHEYSKKTTNNEGFKKFINQQISDFLKGLKVEDLKFDDMKKVVLEKQKDKVFLFINEGNVYSEIIDDKIEITEKMKIKNNNTIVFDSTKENYSVEWLLRWKNHKGCSGPAWQISLRCKN